MGEEGGQGRGMGSRELASRKSVSQAFYLEGRGGGGGWTGDRGGGEGRGGMNIGLMSALHCLLDSLCCLSSRLLWNLPASVDKKMEQQRAGKQEVDELGLLLGVERWGEESWRGGVNDDLMSTFHSLLDSLCCLSSCLLLNLPASLDKRKEQQRARKREVGESGFPLGVERWGRRVDGGGGGGEGGG